MEVTSVEEEWLLHFVFSSSLTVITHKRATMATHRQRERRGERRIQCFQEEGGGGGGGSFVFVYHQKMISESCVRLRTSEDMSPSGSVA